MYVCTLHEVDVRRHLDIKINVGHKKVTYCRGRTKLVLFTGKNTKSIVENKTRSDTHYTALDLTIVKKSFMLVDYEFLWPT